MKLFEISIINDKFTVYTGEVDDEIYIEAYDITSALMTAVEIISSLKEKLIAKGLEKAASSLRIREISERGELINGVGVKGFSAHKDIDPCDVLCEAISKRVKENVDD